MLELDRLQNWAPTRLPAISHNSVVLLGQQVIMRIYISVNLFGLTRTYLQVTL